MPLIALISTKECSEVCWECGGHVVASSISDWDTVTDDELKALRKYSPHRILVREDVSTSLEKVRKAVELAEKQKKEHEEAEKKKKLAREEKKRQKELAKQQLSEEAERAVYENLKKRFECR